MRLIINYDRDNNNYERVFSHEQRHNNYLNEIAKSFENTETGSENLRKTCKRLFLERNERNGI